MLERWGTILWVLLAMGWPLFLLSWLQRRKILSKENPYVAILCYGYAFAWIPVFNHAIDGKPLSSAATPWDSLIFAIVGAFGGAFANRFSERRRDDGA